RSTRLARLRRHLEGAAADRGALWRHPDFLKLWFGDLVSDLGSRVTPLALPLTAALLLDAGPGQMGALYATGYLPPILLGLVAGVWIDRLRRRPVLIWANAGRALVLLTVPAAALIGQLRIELLFAVQLAMALLAVFARTAAVAYLPSLVPRERLVTANSALAAGDALAEVAGPGLAGLLVQRAGAPLAIAADAVSYLAPALCVALIRAPEPPPPPRAGRRPLLAELREGLATLTGQPLLRAFLATMICAVFFYNVIMAVYLLYLYRQLGLSPAAVGVIFGFGGGAGILIGSAIAPAVSRRLGLGRTLVGAHLLFGLGGLLLGLAVFLPAFGAPLVFAAEFLQLAVNGVYFVNRRSVEQAVTPPPLRGRVRAGQSVVDAAAAAAGTLAGAAIGERFGVGAAVLAGVAGGLFSVLWLWWSPVRRLTGLPEESGGLPAGG
ncbi:MAG TPA: MFS transporter, partial [Chloroflexota bacterium]|nr:MFS transporter [Chloroflexota bacterium]